MENIEVGDRIIFRSATRSGNFKANRIVNGFRSGGKPTVRFNGFHDFVVRPDEIMDVIKEEEWRQ